MINKLALSTILSVGLFVFTGCNEKNDSTKEKITIEDKVIPSKPLVEKQVAVKKEKEVVEKKEEQVITKKVIAKEVTNTKIIKIKPIVKKEIKEQYAEQQIKRTSSIATKKTISNFDFDIIKKGYKDNNTLLIVGGIQGDEPGGFMAASLIVTHYEITKGSVWVVPNLNFYSIIKRSRGPYGDMNRKFAFLPKSDPEYKTVQRIKGYISDESVKLIVNLHDGSGFYRPSYEDKAHSPHKWGQCSIIDQETLKNKNYHNLANISKQVVSHVNDFLLKDEDKYHLHNTRTVEGDKEMEKTLTYYAINQGKAAFGNEASKSLPTHERVYYHLLALEKYMDVMGIEYKRKFNLNDKVVKNILDNDIEISLYDNKIKLPLAEIRNMLKFFPVKKDGTIDFIPSNPLMSIVKEKSEYTIYYGNRRISKLKADYIDYHDDGKLVKVKVGNDIKNVPFGSLIEVKDNFLIHQLKDYRVNIIGYRNKKSKIETDVSVEYAKMQQEYSIDKKGLTYRVEFYKQKQFAGMILVKFAG